VFILCFLCASSSLSRVFSTSASVCVERRIPEMTCFIFLAGCKFYSLIQYFMCRPDDQASSAILVHQSCFQQRLLQRYGDSVCLLDATYKTTLYDLPLFMMCVLTNCGYVVVGEFVTADEQSPSIIAGLKALQQHTPDWKPQFVMADFSEAQITAVETVFPGQ